MFNESKAVEVILPRVLGELARHFSDFEIVIADDASTDGCAELAAEWARRDPRIRLVRLAKNGRFGGALRAGLAHARNDFLIYTDFDLPVDLECLARIIPEFDDADLLTGYSPEATKHASPATMIISTVYNGLVRLFFGLPYRDINFGFKAVRRSVFQNFTLQSSSPFIGAELFLEARRHGARIKEIPVRFSARSIGKSQMRRPDVICATLLDMIKVAAALRFGARPTPGAAVKTGQDANPPPA